MVTASYTNTKIKKIGSYIGIWLLCSQTTMYAAIATLGLKYMQYWYLLAYSHWVVIKTLDDFKKLQFQKEMGTKSQKACKQVTVQKIMETN